MDAGNFGKIKVVGLLVRFASLHVNAPWSSRYESFSHLIGWRDGLKCTKTPPYSKSKQPMPPVYLQIGRAGAGKLIDRQRQECKT